MIASGTGGTCGWLQVGQVLGGNREVDFGMVRLGRGMACLTQWKPGAWVLDSQWVPRLDWHTDCGPGLDLVDYSEGIDKRVGEGEGEGEGDDTCWARS